MISSVLFNGMSFALLRTLPFNVGRDPGAGERREGYQQDSRSENTNVARDIDLSPVIPPRIRDARETPL